MDFIERFDQGALDIAFRLHRPWLDPVMIAVTHLGDRVFLTAVVLAAAVFLLVLRLPRTALILTLASLAGFPLSEGVKVLAGRPRPHVAWRLIDLPSSASFPSGHALESAAVYGGMALTLGRRLRRRGARAATLALGFALPLLGGLSRVYVGVHYLTDVLAGWAAGLTLALLAGWADHRWSGGRRNGRSAQEQLGTTTHPLQA